MRIIFIGDIVGRPGREATKKLIPKLKKEFEPHIIIANGENISGGTGLTSAHLDEMHKAGIDFFTSGNHIWHNRDLFPRMDEKDTLVLRPANFPSNNPGRGWRIVETALMKRLLVINLHGRVFMHRDYECPFLAVDKILKETAHEYLDGIFVDIHAEATSEKVAMGKYLDGRVSAVFGTHTHIPTADLQILAGGTAYLTDAGMVGLKDSIIGVDKENILKNFLTQMPVKHEISSHGLVTFCAAYVEIGKDKKAIEVKQILREIEV